MQAPDRGAVHADVHPQLVQHHTPRFSRRKAIGNQVDLAVVGEGLGFSRKPLALRRGQRLRALDDLHRVRLRVGAQQRVHIGLHGVDRAAAAHPFTELFFSGDLGLEPLASGLPLLLGDLDALLQRGRGGSARLGLPRTRRHRIILEHLVASAGRHAQFLLRRALAHRRDVLADLFALGARGADDGARRLLGFLAGLLARDAAAAQFFLELLLPSPVLHLLADLGLQRLALLLWRLDDTALHHAHLGRLNVLARVLVVGRLRGDVVLLAALDLDVRRDHRLLDDAGARSDLLRLRRRFISAARLDRGALRRGGALHRFRLRLGLGDRLLHFGRGLVDLAHLAHERRLVAVQLGLVERLQDRALILERREVAACNAQLAECVLHRLRVVPPGLELLVLLLEPLDLLLGPLDVLVQARQPLLELRIVRTLAAPARLLHALQLRVVLGDQRDRLGEHVLLEPSILPVALDAVDVLDDGAAGVRVDRLALAHALERGVHSLHELRRRGASARTRLDERALFPSLRGEAAQRAFRRAEQEAACLLQHRRRLAHAAIVAATDLRLRALDAVDRILDALVDALTFGREVVAARPLLHQLRALFGLRRQIERGLAHALDLHRLLGLDRVSQSRLLGRVEDRVARAVENLVGHAGGVGEALLHAHLRIRRVGAAAHLLRRRLAAAADGPRLAARFRDVPVLRRVLFPGALAVVDAARLVNQRVDRVADVARRRASFLLRQAGQPLSLAPHRRFLQRVLHDLALERFGPLDQGLLQRHRPLRVGLAHPLVGVERKVGGAALLELRALEEGATRQLVQLRVQVGDQLLVPAGQLRSAAAVLLGLQPRLLADVDGRGAARRRVLQGALHERLVRQRVGVQRALGVSFQPAQLSEIRLHALHLRSVARRRAVGLGQLDTVVGQRLLLDVDQLLQPGLDAWQRLRRSAGVAQVQRVRQLADAQRTSDRRRQDAFVDRVLELLDGVRRATGVAQLHALRPGGQLDLVSRVARGVQLGGLTLAHGGLGFVGGAAALGLLARGGHLLGQRLTVHAFAVGNDLLHRSSGVLLGRRLGRGGLDLLGQLALPQVRLRARRGARELRPAVDQAHGEVRPLHQGRDDLLRAQRALADSGRVGVLECTDGVLEVVALRRRGRRRHRRLSHVDERRVRLNALRRLLANQHLHRIQPGEPLLLLQRLDVLQPAVALDLQRLQLVHRSALLQLQLPDL